MLQHEKDELKTVANRTYDSFVKGATLSTMFKDILGIVDMLEENGVMIPKPDITTFEGHFSDMQQLMDFYQTVVDTAKDADVHSVMVRVTQMAASHSLLMQLAETSTDA